jgi:hypothetical protein
MSENHLLSQITARLHSTLFGHLDAEGAEKEGEDVVDRERLLDEIARQELKPTARPLKKASPRSRQAL